MRVSVAAAATMSGPGAVRNCFNALLMRLSRKIRVLAAPAALALSACASPGIGGGPPESALVPAAIPVARSGLAELTAGLRRKGVRLGLDGAPGLGGESVSRALVLLPRDRSRPGVITFEIEDGPDAGLHQCETMGRGRTSMTETPGWKRGEVAGLKIYWSPMDQEDGATIPGVYDARVISTDAYEIDLLNSPENLAPGDVPPRARSVDPASKPHYSGVWKTWYSATNESVPIDLLWSREYQPLSQGARFPVFERVPAPASDAARLRRDKQLAHNARYYVGPFGRTGFANHTDQWDDPARRADPRYAGRGELSDFRWRNTDGCLKVRPDCLALLDEFVAEQARKNRRVQYDVRETKGLDRVPLVAAPRP